MEHKKEIKEEIKITESVAVGIRANQYLTFYQEFFKYYQSIRESRNARMLAYLFLHLTMESMFSIVPHNVFSHIAGEAGKKDRIVWETLLEKLRFRDKFIVSLKLMGLFPEKKELNPHTSFLDKLSGIRNKIVHGHLIAAKEIIGSDKPATKEETKLYKILDKPDDLKEHYKRFWKFINFYLGCVKKIDLQKIAQGVDINKEKFIGDFESIKGSLKQIESEVKKKPPKGRDKKAK